MTRQPCLFIAASLLVLSHTGCASLKFPGPGSLLKSGSTAPAVRCLCLWQPVETEDMTGQTVRGFGGQVYFFAANSEEPVTVEGDVRVFVFDDAGTPAEQARPKDIQNYDSLTWKSFRNESQVGTNYALFVPYKSASKYEAVCSLRLRLTRPDGSHLFSDMATVKLAGEPREDKSIRQLVSPREHSIQPNRSSELRVNLDPHSNSNGRAATIGSIQEGALSLADGYQTERTTGEHTNDRSAAGRRPKSDRNTSNQTSPSVQQYHARLEEMHAAFETTSSRQQRSTRRLSRDISDLLPAIQQVSGREQQRNSRVTPSAYEVFATEETPPFEPIETNDLRPQRHVPDGRAAQSGPYSAQSIFGGSEENAVQPLSLTRIQEKSSDH